MSEAVQPLSLRDKIVARTILALGSVFVFCVVGFLLGALSGAVDAARLWKYKHCIERGGMITEGGMSGPECVGIKVPEL